MSPLSLQKKNLTSKSAQDINIAEDLVWLSENEYWITEFEVYA